MSTPPGTSPSPTSTPTPTPPSSSPPPPSNSSSSPSPPSPALPPSSSSSSPPPPTTTPSPTPPIIPPPPTSSPLPPSPPSTTPIPPSTSPPPPDTPAATPPSPSTTPPSTTPPPPPTPTPPSPKPPPGSRASPPPPPPSPPPLVPGRSPPRPSSSTPPAPPSSDSSTISTGLVVGVAIGGVIVLVIATLLFICCKKKKKRRDDHHGQHYGYPPPPPLKEGGQHQQWQYNVPPPAPPSDHVVSIPPKVSPPPAHASRPPLSSSSVGSMPQPPPPPPFMNNSGGSGSNYSDYDSPLPPPSPGMGSMGGFSKSTFTYEELVRATDGFSDANLLGQGGFGYVHKGVLPNGKEVAIKQLKIGSGQGEREFQAEVEIISRVHHKHLVSLVGYCSTGAQRMLVYEFVPNNTLEFHLHGKERPTMEWSSRLKIALGSAKGLAYLHEDCHPKIIHRDIKSSNILLDLRFEAKVADFGLAKFSSDTNTHVSTRVMGTFGYLAPEYAASGKLTEKSDVFSFGVMLLELITGRRPVDSQHTFMDDSLVDWARPLLTRALEDSNYDTLADPRLQRSYNHNEMGRMVSCAAAAVRHSSRRRPQMSQIVRALEGDASLADLSEGVRPGHSTVYSSFESSDYDTHQYNEDMKKFRKMALSSQQYGSSEYSGPTSEYGLYPSGSSSEGQTTREIQMKKNPKDSQGFSGES